MRDVKERSVARMKSVVGLGALAAVLFAWAPSFAEELSAAEMLALRDRMQQCWTLPASAHAVEVLPVQVEVRLDGDGSLLAPPQVIGGKLLMTGDRSPYQELAKSAQEAVLACAPFRLPAQKYPAWREMRLVFNPRVAAPCFLCSSCHGGNQMICGQSKGRVGISFNGAHARNEGM